MHELEISSIEKSTIIARDSEGQEYRVDVDEASLGRLKRNYSAENSPKISPREIQSLLRSGLSLDEVSSMTGATSEQIDRYATPILAEREYVINTAQTLQAFAHVENTEDGSLFGQIVGDRLDIVDARDRVWTAWKNDDNKWILKLTFTVAGVDRDARWVFDGKRQSVTPNNEESKLLSAPGSFTPPVASVLRAVPLPANEPIENGDAASEGTIVEIDTLGETTPLLVDIETDSVVTSVDTVDLLEALRRRRSKSDEAPAWLRDDIAARNAPANEVFDDALDFSLEIEASDDTQAATVFPISNTGGHKRNRPTMPKWDDIVSETKSDDDLI